MSRLRLSPSIFRDTDVLLQCLIVRTTAGRLQIYALPKSTTRSIASFYVQRGLSRAMAFTFTDCTWCSVYLEKIGLQILRPRDNVARETRSMASRLHAVFEREPIGKLWGNAVHLAFLVWRSSSHLTCPSLLKSKWSRKNKSPSSENRPPLGLQGAIRGKQVS